MRDILQMVLTVAAVLIGYATGVHHTRRAYRQAIIKLSVQAADRPRSDDDPQDPD